MNLVSASRVCLDTDTVNACARGMKSATEISIGEPCARIRVMLIEFTLGEEAKWKD